MLYHDIGVLWPGNRYEKKLITLVSYGETNGYTAMAKTVGIPTAITATMVLQGGILTESYFYVLFSDLVYQKILMNIIIDILNLLNLYLSL